MSDSFLSKELVEKAKKDEVQLYSDRYSLQKPQCPWCIKGTSCNICAAGPCRITPEKNALKGVCGASSDVIIARNLLRHCAAGVSSHVDHAREVVLTLLKIGNNKKIPYKICDEQKLRKLAKALGKNSKGNIRKIAKVVAMEALEDFRRQEGIFHKTENNCLNWLRINASKERQETWKRSNLLPLNADLETSRALHVSTMGNDSDVNSLMLRVLRNGIADGYAGLHLTTNLQDILFGTPTLTKSECNLGVINKDYVNIAVHGHVPLLSEKIIEWSKKLNKTANSVGAKGINVVGICCSGNEVLMRHGIPQAGHILQAELAIVTGALEAMVVDTQCIYPSLQDVASCYHTKIITTMVAKITGADHVPFNVENANKAAKEIVLKAINNFKNRNQKTVLIPKERSVLYGGFSAETILTALSKLNKKNPIKPLADNIKKGNIQGIVAVVGCRNPKLEGEKFGEQLMKILVKNNILVVATGCIAHSASQEGLMIPEATEKYAGEKLKAVLNAIGRANNLNGPLPPVLHMGSCVDNSRIEVILNAISSYAKLAIHKLPIAASAPEYMTEKAIAIAFWSLALGITTHINPEMPINGSGKVVDFLTRDMEKITGSRVIIGKTPEEAAKVIINTIKKKRLDLGYH